MKKPRRQNRKPISITIHPALLKMIDARAEGKGRSQQISLDLSRYYSSYATRLDQAKNGLTGNTEKELRQLYEMIECGEMGIGAMPTR